jgi:hypothetical protein
MKGRVSSIVLLIFAAHLFGGCSGKMDTPNGSDVFMPGKRAGAEVVGDFGKLPLSFEMNRGQADERVRFIARGSGFRVYLTPDEVVMVVAARAGPEDGRGARGSAAKETVSRSRYAVGMQFTGAGFGRKISGGRLLPGKSSYILGNDPDKWLTDIPNYERVIYRELYPGIDLEIYGSRVGIEYDFVVRPGFDPRAIGLSFSGAREAAVDEGGNLVITTGAGEVIHHAPRLYQRIADGRKQVAGRFAKREDGTFGFAVSSYDTGNALVIDPEITFGTYLGGANLDEALGLAVDSDGNAYLAGRTFSDDFPVTAGAYDVECGSDSFCDDSGLISDIFVAKLSSSGTGLLYATYIGGSGDDSAAGIGIDDAGNAYVAGRTESTDFPLLDPFRFNLSGFSDAFLLVLNPTGSLLRYSTYFGGSGDDEALAVAVSSGDAFVAGSTGSTDLHTDNPLQIDFGGGVTDGFVARFDIDIFLGTGLPTYSTYIGGSEDDSVKGLAADASGDIYLTGRTNSDDFPTKNPLTDVGGDSRSGGEDAFAAKIKPSFVGISALVYSTYLGGTGSDSGSAHKRGELRRLCFEGELSRVVAHLLHVSWRKRLRRSHRHRCHRIRARLRDGEDRILELPRGGTDRGVITWIR